MRVGAREMEAVKSSMAWRAPSFCAEASLRSQDGSFSEAIATNHGDQLSFATHLVKRQPAVEVQQRLNRLVARIDLERVGVLADRDLVLASVESFLAFVFERADAADAVGEDPVEKERPRSVTLACGSGQTPRD